jgi:hypothetical protein
MTPRLLQKNAHIVKTTWPLMIGFVSPAKKEWGDYIKKPGWPSNPSTG